MPKSPPKKTAPPPARPQAPDAKNGAHAWIYCAIAGILVLLDQLSKAYFQQRLQLFESIDVLNPVLSFTLIYNKGAAFSFLAGQPGWQKWFFIGLGGLVSLFLLYQLWHSPKKARTLALGFALVLGGALGNVIDRLRFGQVVDFIHVHYGDVWHYPIFNVADIGICVGVALLLLDMLFLEKKRLP